ncbi:MAG TPA: hypothetical protein VNF71_09210 [Acidimicrobiales bacterium]|nr:hypothetical protein [Acidimicrobiales bacterium]
MAVELAVAAVVLGAVALLAGGSSAPRHHDDAQFRWSSHALPALTRLVGDLTSLGSDAAPGSPAAPRMARDAAALQADLASAKSLGPPPAQALRPGWNATLTRVGSVVASSEATVAAAGSPSYDVQLTGLRSAIAAAGDALIQLAGGLRTTA